MKDFIFILPCFLFFSAFAQNTHKSFELRYFTNDPKANGETDFKGETEWMDTEMRILFLNDYANYASRFYENTDFDRKVNSENEVEDILANIKPQPITNIRQTELLNSWKAYGYKSGQDVARQEAMNKWESYNGASVEHGALKLNNASIERNIDSLNWRFKFQIKIRLEEGSASYISLKDGNKQAISLNLKNGALTVISSGEEIIEKLNVSDEIKIEVEGDFTQKRFNLILNGQMLHYYIPMTDTTLTSATRLSIQTEGKSQVDDLFILNHVFNAIDVRRPYHSVVIIDENFEVKSPVEGWQKPGFDDSLWKTVDLPSVHGGIREEGESYYLRKKFRIGSFEKATLLFETVDPGGEVWVNNQVVAVIDTRHPVELNLTPYLKPNSENLIAVKVKPFKSNDPMVHAPTDINIGWFLGRAKLLLGNKCSIKNALVNTVSLGNPVVQAHKIRIHYAGKYYFKGSLDINYYPWFPEEGEKVAAFSQQVQVRPGVENEFQIEMPVYDPQLWSPMVPMLYKVEIILKDQNGKPIDDYLTTTGIRTVEQKDGNFYLNGKPAMLNGSQIIGYRTPIETIAKTNRCAPPEIIAEELLMIKKMGGNLLRMHVHAQKDTTDGINDPRYAELADQLGVCLIWQTAGWVRNGEAWNIDFKGLPKYMEQVYNHPSIVMWETGNHPNKFKEHDIMDTHDFVRNTYRTVYSVDQSRMISPTSFWQHTHYANYDGTMDYKGNKIQAVPEFMAPRMTRGSQDAYTGYGQEWSVLRNAPNHWAASCIAAKDMAYFNFEHEESIGQPNWELCKGKPWYLLQSYEWEYDEGSIGRKLMAEEWKASQAWQAFSAWESMKKQILLGYDGFSWCCLHGGPNMGTYKKPLIDNLGHPKLAFYANKMVFQKTWGGSNNVDVVYGPNDQINPVVNHFGDYQKADLLIQLESLEGKIIDRKKFENIELKNGHSITKTNAFRFKDVPEGTYIIHYEVIEK